MIYIDGLRELLKQFEGHIETTANNLKTLRDNPEALVVAREVALTLTKLQEAKMWLSEASDEIADKTPQAPVEQAPQPQVNQPAQAENPAPSSELNNPAPSNPQP